MSVLWESDRCPALAEGPVLACVWDVHGESMCMTCTQFLSTAELTLCAGGCLADSDGPLRHQRNCGKFCNTLSLCHLESACNGLSCFAGSDSTPLLAALAHAYRL